MVIFQSHRHPPGGFACGDDEQGLSGDFIKNTASERSANQMNGIDAGDSCTKDVVQVGA